MRSAEWTSRAVAGTTSEAAGQGRLLRPASWTASSALAIARGGRQPGTLAIASRASVASRAQARPRALREEGERQVAHRRGGVGRQDARAADADRLGEVGLRRVELTQPGLDDAELDAELEEHGEREAARPVAEHELGRRHGLLERLEPEPGPHQLDAGDLARESRPAAPAAARTSLSIQCSACGMSSSNQRSAQTANHASGWSSTTSRVLPDERPHGRPAVVGDQLGSVRGEHLRGCLGMVQAQQATEGPAAVSPGSVQSYGAQHRGPRPFHVLAAGGDPSPHDLGEQRMDPVARASPSVASVADARVTISPVVSSSARVAAASGSPVRCRAVSTETISSLATHSSRWRSWAGREANTSDATASATGDSWSRRRRAATERVARRGEAPGGQHHCARTIPACAR